MWRGDILYIYMGLFFVCLFVVLGCVFFVYVFFFLGGGGGANGSEVGCNDHFCIVYFHIIQQF